MADVLRVFELASGREIASGGQQGRVLALALSDDGERALVAMGRGELWAWEMEGVRWRGRLVDGGLGLPVSVAFAGADVAAAIGRDGSLREYAHLPLERD